MEQKILKLDERNQIVESNINLVRYLVYNKLQLSPEDAEDAVQIGCIGLIKAVDTYNPNKKVKFSSYASRCIVNEIYMYFRKEKKHLKNVSLDDIIKDTNQDSPVTFINILGGEDTYQYEKLEEMQEITRILNFVLNNLSGSLRLSFLYRISGATQAKIAQMLGTSRSYVSRLVLKAQKTIKEYFDGTIFSAKKDIFRMSVLNEHFYQLSFTSNDVGNFNEILVNLLMRAGEDPKILSSSFEVRCKEGEITIILAVAEPKSFEFLGRLIQEIDKYGGTAKN